MASGRARARAGSWRAAAALHRDREARARLPKRKCRAMQRGSAHYQFRLAHDALLSSLPRKPEPRSCWIPAVAEMTMLRKGRSAEQSRLRASALAPPRRAAPTPYRDRAQTARAVADAIPGGR